MKHLEDSCLNCSNSDLIFDNISLIHTEVTLMLNFTLKVAIMTVHLLGELGEDIKRMSVFAFI